MKYFLVVIIIITSCVGIRQRNTNDEITLLRLELLRNRDKFSAMNIGDSILIDKMAPPLLPLKRYRDAAIADRHMSEDEAGEIFGDARNAFFNEMPDKSFEWTKASFPSLKVALYDPEKYTNAYTFGKSKKIGVGTFNIRYISKPLILSNKKYALIAWGSEHYGTMASIYKNNGGKWVFYKEYGFM